MNIDSRSQRLIREILHHQIDQIVAQINGTDQIKYMKHQQDIQNRIL